MTGDLFALGFTTSENAGSETLVVPSLTEMVMLLQVHMCSAFGVPDNLPVVEENEVNAGLLAIEKVSVLWSASEAVGVNDQTTPTVAVVTGVPEIFGAAAEAADVAVIENAATASAQKKDARDARAC